MVKKVLLEYSENIIDRLISIARKNKIMASLYKIFIQNFIIDKNYPYIINIETTNACNLNCVMCPRKQSNRKIGFIDFELFKKIVDESNKHGNKIYTLHKDGEPLLHPKIIDMIKYIKTKSKGNTIYLTTNGHFLDESKAIEIIKLGVEKLNISVGAATPKTYEKVRGSRNLKLVEDNINRIIRIKKLMKSKKPHIVVQIIKMEETLNEINTFVKKWEKEDVKVSVWDFLNWGGEKKDKTMKWANKRYPCYSLWLAPVINWDGKVSICCIDWNCNEIIGDLNRNGFAEIWKSEKLKRYRKLHLKGEYEKIGLCKSCNSWLDYPDFFFGWQKNEKC